MGPIVPKTTCDTRGGGDVDRTGPKASSGPIVLSGTGTTPLPQNGTRLRQQLSFSFSLCSCVQLLAGGVAEQ